MLFIPRIHFKNTFCEGDNSTLKGRARTVWLLDSFEGLPPPDAALFPADAHHVGDAAAANSQVLEANSQEAVAATLQRLGLTDGVRLIRGFFKDRCLHSYDLPR